MIGIEIEGKQKTHVSNGTAVAFEWLRGTVERRLLCSAATATHHWLISCYKITGLLNDRLRGNGSAGWHLPSLVLLEESQIEQPIVDVSMGFIQDGFRRHFEKHGGRRLPGSLWKNVMLRPVRFENPFSHCSRNTKNRNRMRRALCSI
jgi:hypothetical protein